MITRMQYLAIRKVFDDEIFNSCDDTVMFSDVLKVLVEEPEKYSIEERNKVLADANLLSPAVVAKKATRLNASTAWVTAFAGAAVATAIGIGVSALLKDKE